MVEGVVSDITVTAAGEGKKDSCGEPAVVGELENGALVEVSVEYIVLVGSSWLLDFVTEVVISCEVVFGVVVVNRLFVELDWVALFSDTVLCTMLVFSGKIDVSSFLLVSNEGTAVESSVESHEA
ncbi:unnamed protein product [Nippostrongylus brasiliensis]|uniref:Uncharacterized protein n=1 Tax=Nippostrongylus brasiliensis TaxID=27835 RepID=A0A0N4YFQ1_NIPBR|nr:unnamed protein product [Nippostrongylus brasiliensis]